MKTHTPGIILNGVTGRMGTNQHYIRSLLAIIKQGGVRISDGETIVPKLLDGKRAWFRVYFAFGETIPCWWDNVTHRYTELLPGEEERYGLEGLRGAALTIRRICGLDFFSSEVALTDDGRLVIVDYVNEVCDMRYQSVHSDGAPDAVVHRIEKLIARHVKSHLIPEKGI